MAKRRKRGRDIDGILLLDKPIDITSNKALQDVKYLYFAAKAGHTGALDPIATGVLPICLGEGTKFSQFLLNADKKYQVVAKLGEKTTTADREGDVIESRPVTCSEKEFLSVMEQFKGSIKQVPSMYSALKHNGTPLYELARQGIEIDRPAREVEIYSLELINFDGNLATMDVHCSKGTYVRNLVEDIGELLGCGAHVQELRRTAVSQFDLAQTVTMEYLRDLKERDEKIAMDELLMPIESALASCPVLELTTDEAYYIKQGQALYIAEAPAAENICLVEKNRGFIGVAKIDADGKVAPNRLIKQQEQK